MNFAAWVAQLEQSPLGEWMRASWYAYPLINVVHLVGLVLLVGSMVLLDLRLLGAARRLTIDAASALLTPAAVAGLLLMLGSGFLLFAADAGALLINPLFPFKILFVTLGIANALLFRALWSDRLVSWDQHPPIAGRAQALASFVIWIAAGILGRLLAYA